MESLVFFCKTTAISSCMEGDCNNLLTCWIWWGYHGWTNGKSVRSYLLSQRLGFNSHHRVCNSFPHLAQEVTFTRLQTSGSDLGNLLVETTGSAKGNLAMSQETIDSEVMIPIQLNHKPRIQKWQPWMCQLKAITTRARRVSTKAMVSKRGANRGLFIVCWLS